MEERERIAVLEEAVKYLAKSIDEVKEALHRIEEKQDKHIEEIAVLRAKAGIIAFVVGGVVSGIVSFFIQLMGKKV